MKVICKSFELYHSRDVIQRRYPSNHPAQREAGTFKVPLLPEPVAKEASVTFLKKGQNLRQDPPKNLQNKGQRHQTDFLNFFTRPNLAPLIPVQRKNGAG